MSMVQKSEERPAAEQLLEDDPQQPGLRPPKTSTLIRIGAPLALAVVVIAAWHLMATYDDLPNVVLPAPKEVWDAFFEFRGVLFGQMWATVSAALLGFALAAVFAVVLAMALSYSRLLNASLYPGLVAFHAIPKAALAPLLLIYFGFGIETKVIVGFLTAVFPITVATTAGLRSVSGELHDLARSLHASRLRTFWKIDFPHALPFFFSGLRVGIALALVGVVVGEFVVSDRGLAVMLERASAQFQAPLAFAAMGLLSLLSLTLFGLIVLLERVAVPYRARGRG